MTLIITLLMVRISIVHYHLQDTATQQMLQTTEVGYAHCGSSAILSSR
jgi:hypothetical protein